MDLALNNLQMLICYQTPQTNQPTKQLVGLGFMTYKLLKAIQYQFLILHIYQIYDL